MESSTKVSIINSVRQTELTSLFFSNKDKLVNVIFIVDDVIIMDTRVIISEGAHVQKLV